MNASEYKNYHESFMQNNHGSSALHTFLSINFTVLSVMICSVTGRYSPKCQYCYEYIMIVFPLILGHTILAKYTALINVFMLSILISVVYRYRHKSDLKQVNNEVSASSGQKLASVSCMRALTYLVTVFSILAVDFKVFPRHLAKTERFGYSLMDTGVGLFVLMSGLVHKNHGEKKIAGVLKNNYKLILILVTLGVLRFHSLRQLDYQEHVTEYGVHWNFFYTLAVSKVISSVLLYLVNVKYSLLLCITTKVLHQMFLSLCLQKWVFSELARDNFLLANREGISSCLGYVSLYLFSVYMKQKITQKSIVKYKIIFSCLIMSIILWSLTFIIHSFNPTSRTLANIGYCVFVEAILVTVFVLLYTLEVTFQGKEQFIASNVPLIVSAVSDNGLLFFLMGNVTTGLINFTFRTLLVDDYFAVIILVVYMNFNILFAIYLQNKGIRL